MIRTAAEAAGLAPGAYAEVLSESLLAVSRVTDACMEIPSGYSTSNRLPEVSPGSPYRGYSGDSRL